MSVEQNSFEGYFDQVLSGLIFGWAWQSDLPNDPIYVDVYIDNVYQSSIVANVYRADLEKAGKGNGRHAFQIKVPTRFYDGQFHAVRIRYQDTGVDLQGSPQPVCLEPKRGFAYRVNSVQERAALDRQMRLWIQENPREKPKVSVVIPCYNLGEFLDEAVDSVFEQTYRDFEIIVVNDGSTDAFTNRLLENYSRPRVKILHTDNRGPGAARNIGIKAAAGTYLCALDADDKLHPSYFEKAVKVLDDDESTAFVSSWLQTFGDEEWLWKQERCDLPTLLSECTVTTPALVRKAAVTAVGGYDEDVAQWGNEDWLLWISLVERGYQGVILPEVLFYYRKRLGSLSAFWGQGEAHLAKLRSVIAKHGQSYRKSLIDVLLRKEGDICDLLRQNEATERSIHWLKQQVLSWQKEIARLRAKLDQHQVPQAPAQNHAELLQQMAEKSRCIEALEVARAQLEQRATSLETALQGAEHQLLAMRRSRSWMVTAPLRAINARLSALTMAKLWTSK